MKKKSMKNWRKIRTMKSSDELNKEKEKKLKQQNYEWKNVNA